MPSCSRSWALESASRFGVGADFFPSGFVLVYFSFRMPTLLQFAGVPGGIRKEHVTRSHKAEQWALCARVAFLSDALHTVASKFERFLRAQTKLYN